MQCTRDLAGMTSTRLACTKTKQTHSQRFAVRSRSRSPKLSPAGILTALDTCTSRRYGSDNGLQNSNATSTTAATQKTPDIPDTKLALCGRSGTHRHLPLTERSPSAARLVDVLLRCGNGRTSIDPHRASRRRMYVLLADDSFAQEAGCTCQVSMSI
jgi:hypothetical protein